MLRFDYRPEEQQLFFLIMDNREEKRSIDYHLERFRGRAGNTASDAACNACCNSNTDRLRSVLIDFHGRALPRGN